MQVSVEPLDTEEGACGLTIHQGHSDSGVSVVFGIDRKGKGKLEKETWYGVLQGVMSFELTLKKVLVD